MIGGAGAALQSDDELITMIPDIAYIVDIVVEYLLRTKKRVSMCTIGTMSGIMPLSFLTAATLSMRQINTNSFIAINVYPYHTVYNPDDPGRSGVSKQMFTTDQREGKMFDKLFLTDGPSLSVKASRQSREIDPNGKNYHSEAYREWRAASEVLCDLSDLLVKDGGKKVTVLCNGGRMAAEEVALKLNKKERVIVIRNSGRLADIIVNLIEGRQSQSELALTFLNALRKECNSENYHELLSSQITILTMPTRTEIPDDSVRLQVASNRLLSAIEATNN
jgi:hypothetical protein